MKAKRQESRNNRMILAFFDSNGLVYTDIVAKGTTVNAQFIVGSLTRFLAHFGKKRRELKASKQWFFH